MSLIGNEALPRHLAIIMDGNGRWAEKRGLPRIAGHQAGMQAVTRTIEECVDLRISFLTLYAFSIENWFRPKSEVNFIFSLAEEFIYKNLESLQEKNVHVQHMGRRNRLPAYLLRALDRISDLTKNNTGMSLNLAINYGGRAEVVDAMRSMIIDHQEGKLEASGIDEAVFSRYLYCQDVPDADLVLRTSGEYRLSNFPLWR